DYLALLDWRRQVADMYREVRARLGVDPIDAPGYWRRHRGDLFRSHSQSPLPADERARFAGLRYYDHEPRFPFPPPVPPLPQGRHEVAASGGRVVPMVRIGAVDLPVGTLDVLWLDAYGGGVFLPIADSTAAKTTYGGGRYLLDSAKGADLGARGGALVVDFNFAYHPSCAYDPQGVCPLAPAANRLPVAIEAGERLHG